MRGMLVVLLSMLLALPGCTAARTDAALASPRPAGRQPDPVLVAEYMRRIPVGSRVRIRLSGGEVIRATLLSGDADPAVLQRRTRVPEPPFTIPLRDVLAIELDTNGSIGRTIAIAAAAGAGATLGVLLVLAALLAD